MNFLSRKFKGLLQNYELGPNYKNLRFLIKSIYDKLTKVAKKKQKKLTWDLPKKKKENSKTRLSCKSTEDSLDEY